ncbi:MAG: quinolinate synthase NadA [Elusimicrobiota bacterium]
MGPDIIVARIKTLKKKLNAVILAHNYQLPEVQDIADFLGDSLDLSRKAASTEADVIVFCGVHFMAETAAILSPEKTVLLPAIDSGCPMADMIDAAKLAALKKNHPNAVVAAYVNTSAEVKAESDICVTSANAVQIIKSLGGNPATAGRDIIFVPDRNLGHYVMTQTGKDMILYDGYCPTHNNILPEHVLKARQQHPGAEVVVHPECRPEVIKLADKVLSTSGMVNYAKTSKNKEIIIGTEPGIIYRLKKDSPDKEFYPASDAAVCRNMKKNTLEKVLWSLENMKNVIKVEEPVRSKAKLAIDKMLEYSRQD